MMSSKKGYSLEQVDDTNYGTSAGVKCGDGDSYSDIPTPQPEDADGGVAAAIAWPGYNATIDESELVPPPPNDSAGLHETTPALTKTKVSNKEFVEKWLSCDSYITMSFSTGMSVSAVQARATRLRKAKVNLPSFTRVTRKTKEIDVVDLNNIIKNNQKVVTTDEN